MYFGEYKSALFSTVSEAFSVEFRKNLPRLVQCHQSACGSDQDSTMSGQIVVCKELTL